MIPGGRSILNRKSMAEAQPLVGFDRPTAAANFSGGRKSPLNIIASATSSSPLGTFPHCGQACNGSDLRAPQLWQMEVMEKLNHTAMRKS
jgi:hypothetical protein